jgi:predicted AAA+ superfamily ATPase
LRNEVTKTGKYYFYDTGVRNAIIQNFSTLDLRDDKGALWENFLMSERLKMRTYKGLSANAYFWRTWEQQEIDLVEERDGLLHAWEFKWQASKHSTVSSRAFLTAYPGSTFQLVDRSSFLPFLLGD